jgi:hypothetical protein
MLAFENYLKQPFIPTKLRTDSINHYWECCRQFNWVVDSLSLPISTQQFRIGRLEGIKYGTPFILEQTAPLRKSLFDAIGSLGPLIPL